MEQLKTPLTNLQLELLKLYAQEVSDEDLRAIKKMLAKYFAEKAMDAADKVWEEKEWNDEVVEKLSNTRMRTPYKSILIR